jgi:dienelactone hydrolase
MDPRFVALYLAGTGLLLAGTALAGGPFAAFLGSPLAVGVGLVALALWRGFHQRSPRRVVAAGAVTILAGLGLALFGPTGAGLATAVAGIGALLCGTQLALSLDPPSPEHVPSQLDARLNLGVASDELLLLYWELFARARRHGDPRAMAAEVLEAAQRNAERGWLENPEQAHPVPPTLEKPRLVSRELRGTGPFEHLTFSSEHEPHDREIHAQYLAAEDNRTAHVYLWRHRGEPRPTLLAIHGYGMGRIGFDARAFDIPRLHNQLGLDVAAVVLPLHGPRAMLRRSGAGFLDGHPLWTNAAFTQAIWDLRRVSGWLRSQGVPSLGVYGLSLGGYTASLFASLESGLACVIPAVPVVNLATLTWLSMGETERHTAEATGLDEGALERAWWIHCPLRFAPRVAPSGRLIVAAAADRITPPDQAQALFEHWQQPAIHWFPGTHTGWSGYRRTRERIDAHLRATLLAQEVGDPPTTNDAPSQPDPSPQPDVAPLSRFRS